MTSCSQISAELAALSAQISALDDKFILKTEKQGIIDSSVQTSKAAIIPQIPNIAGAIAATVFGQKISPFNIRLGNNEKLTGDALNKAKQGLEKAFQAADAAKTAGQVAGEAKGLSLSALAKILSITLQIANILATIATFLTLKARIDALENYTDSLANQISKAFGQILTATSKANQANSKADANTAKISNINATISGLKAQVSSAINSANNAIAKANQSISKADNALSTANTASSKADNALSTANTASSKADNALSTANTASSKADNALGTANTASSKADNALSTANTASSKADNALSTANTASSKADNALGTANTASSKADNALGTANTASSKADNALGTANTASSKANSAASNAFASLTMAGSAIGIAQTVAGGLSALTQEVGTVEGVALEALALAKQKQPITDISQQFDQFVQQNNQKLGVQDLKISDLGQQFNQNLEQFKQQSNLTSQQKFDQFVQQNNQKLGVQDLKISDLGQQFNQNLEQFKQQSNLTSQQKFDQFVQQNNQKLGVQDLKISDLGQQFNQKSQQQEQVNQQSNLKLDQLIGLAALIPANVNNLVTPKLITPAQVQSAAGTAICNSVNGGCLGKGLDGVGNKIGNSLDKAKKDILDKINAAANAAQLALLQKIDLKLGVQIAGGISGKLVDGFKWLKIDRILNTLTFAATVHNATMLSNDLLQTLVGVLTNVLTLIVPKDDAGNTFNVGEAINGTVENAVKGIIGAENYTALSNAWAKANRIYQATTNVLNSFMNLTQTVLQAAEMIAAYTGKIGNALKKGGVVLENAYGWMNPSPKFNRMTQTLENLQQAASTVQMVTQVPLDVINATTELTTASTEFVKAVKEDDKPENKAVAQPEPDKLKADEATAKTASQPNPFDFLDLFDGED
ncbi:alanine-zipper protein [Nodularia sp. LEGE 04288]|uniref:alanine-zipper protein n=1 Tax=Nodularia sp. LEGE 04288 TaxID=1828639 RepID=UPI001D11D46E|nr:alanine-zipper protein [Nodularia sp. LEGE 04288]MCC2695167.1 hypothetical protein [Nodularia sp. LEGE 04288]